jgi:hypothetical protein
MPQIISIFRAQTILESRDGNEIERGDSNKLNCKKKMLCFQPFCFRIIKLEMLIAIL